MITKLGTYLMLEIKKQSSQRKAQVQVFKQRRANQVVNPRQMLAPTRNVLHVAEARNYSYAFIEKTEAIVGLYV